MNTIQRKLFVYAFLISVVPAIILGSFYYNSSLEISKIKVNQATTETFSQLDKNISVKTSRLQNVIDLIFANGRIQEILRETDFRSHSDDTLSAIKELDIIFEQVFLNEKDFNSIVLFSTKGGMYTYRCSMEEDNLVSFTMQYGRPDETTGKITWLGNFNNWGSDESNQNILLTGAVVKDTTYMSDNKFLATMYIALERDYFESQDSNATNSSSIMVYNENGHLIMSTGEYVLDNIWNISLNLGREMYSGEKGDCKLKIGDHTFMITYDTSPSTGWKYARMVLYDEYIHSFKPIQYVNLFAVAFLIIIILLVNYMVIRKITLPIKEIIYAMREVCDGNFQVSMKQYSNDEFGMISRGFNVMVERINTLFNQIIKVERKKKDADIMALQYQMTPHFVYNVLSSIRLLAMYKGENEISEMLMIMGRFLRSTINNAGKPVMLRDEMKNIEDYIALYQIRYENRISASCETDESVADCFIPAMLIQPIVENAIIHGLNMKLDNDFEAVLSVRVTDCDDKLCISVYDNGVGMDSDKIKSLYDSENKTKERMHIGIANVQERIQGLFGAQYGIKFMSEIGSFTQADIYLPKLLSEDEIKNHF